MICMKTCRKCGVAKEIDEFYRDKAGRDGHRPECKICTKTQRAAWYEANREREIERVTRWNRENPERVQEWRANSRADGRRRLSDRKSHLKRTFGITLEDYDRLLAAQGGGCAICGRTPREDIALHVDHDHVTGKVRGILCFKHNNALGDFDDDPELLRRALAYLTSGGQQLIPTTRPEHRLDAIIRERAYALKVLRTA